jgi:hypothetical protein
VAKVTGLAWTACSLDDSGGAVVAIVNDVTTCTFATPRGVQDVTGMDKSAYERLLLLADFSCTLTGVFNPALSHTALSTVPSTSAVRTLTLTTNGVTLANEVLVTDYALTRGAGGELTWTAPCVLANGAAPTWA